MTDLARIRPLDLDELLDRVPEWLGMSPTAAIAAVGKAEADDIVEQLATIVAEETHPTK